MTARTFVAPEPGEWSLTREARPFSRVIWPLLEESWGAGFKDMAKDYGLFFHTRARLVNGFLYQSMYLFDLAPWRRLCLAPLALRRGVRLRGVYFKVVLRYALRHWFDTMKSVFARKPWRAQLATWDNETKPAMAAAFAALTEVRPSELSDAELGVHLRRCAEVFVHAWQHADGVTLIWMVPVGDYLAHAQSEGRLSELELASSMTWLGGSRATPFRVIDQGASLPEAALSEAAAMLGAPLSTTGKVDGLWEILRRADPCLYTHCRVQSLSPVFGFDVVEPSLCEMPELLLESLEEVFSPAARAPRTPELPEDGRLGSLVAEARAVMRVKDERELLLQGPARGLLRRALLEVGARLTARERLGDRQDVFEVSIDEAVALLETDHPSVRRRAEEQRSYRLSATSDDAPALLGGVAADVNKMASAGFSWLPEEGARRLLTALVVASDWRSGPMDAVPPEAARSVEADPRGTNGVVIRGIPASAGQYQGRARLVLGGTLDELERIEQDDVLVAEMTSTTFMPILARVKAVVTDFGGPLSHPAVVAREYGIPSVVGCQSATKQIRDGDLLLVDGTHGTVEIIRSLPEESA